MAAQPDLDDERLDRAGPPDLRLVPAAVAAWAAVLLGLAGGPLAGAVVMGVAGGVAVVVHRARRAPWLLAVAACMAAAAAVVTVATLFVLIHPLHAPAQRGAAARLRVELTDDPRALRPTPGTTGGGTPQVVVPARLAEADVGDGRWRVGGAVLLLAPAATWQGLLPGQTCVVEGLLVPPERADLTVAVLRVRGAPREVTAPPWWQTVAGGLRSGLRGAATAALGPAEAGLLPGLAVGDTSGLATGTADDFRAAGLTHLVAVSGDMAHQARALISRTA